MSKKAFLGLIALYFVVGVITYGHCASRIKDSLPADTFYPRKQELAAASGMMAAMFWPLYWSQHFFESKP